MTEHLVDINHIHYLYKVFSILKRSPKPYKSLKSLFSTADVIFDPELFKRMQLLQAPQLW